MEQYLEPLVDATFAMAMAARDEVALGRVRPRSVSDVVRALEAWARFRPTPESEGISVDEHDADLAAVIEVARRHMDPARYAAFVEDLRAAGRQPRPRGSGDPAL